MRLLPLLILTVTLVCAAATACTGPSTAASAEAAPSARESGHAAAVLTHDATAQRRRWRLFGALQILTQRCMREHGLRYLITSAGPQPPAGATTAESIGSRSAPGYGVSTVLGSLNGGGTAQDRYVRSLSTAAQARYTAVLDGPAGRTAPLTLPSGSSGTYATGGCTARARAGLYGTVRAALEDTLVPQDVDQLLERYLAHRPRLPEGPATVAALHGRRRPYGEDARRADPVAAGRGGPGGERREAGARAARGGDGRSAL